MATTDGKSEELEAIEAIYGEDFSIERQTSAWKREIYSVNIKLRSHSSSSDHMACSLVLCLILPPAYPNTKPKIELRETVNCSQTRCDELKRNLTDMVEQIHGREMIFELTSMVQEFLNDWQNMHQTQTKSLEDERNKRIEYQLAQLKLNEEKSMTEYLQSVKKEEESMKQFVESKMEIKRKVLKSEIKKVAAPHLKKGSCDEMPWSILFERKFVVGDSSLNFFEVDEIRNLVRINKGKQASIYLGSSLIKQTNDQHVLALKVLNFTSPDWLTDRGRELFQNLENRLDRVRLLRHDKILPIYEFQSKIGVTGGFHFYIAQKYCRRGSLREILEVVNSISYDQARIFAIDILEGLDFIHSQDVSHNALHCGNVIIERTSSRAFALVADFGYTDYLAYMSQKIQEKESSAILNITSQYPTRWLPPELRYTNQNLFEDRDMLKRIDLWYYGVLIIQMLYGLDVLYQFDTPNDVLSLCDQIPSAAIDFLSQILTDDPQKRPGTIKLFTTHFVRLNNHIRGEFLDNQSSNATLHSSGQIYNSTNDNLRETRWKSDFDAISIIGKGGFGEVIKARNKLDGRLYAIKKISLLPDERANGRILREIVTISRLSHEYIVRYYSTWVEDFSMNHSIQLENENAESSKPVSIDAFDDFSAAEQKKSDFSSIDIHFSNSVESTAFLDSKKSNNNSHDLNSFKENASVNTGYHNATIYIQMEYCEGSTLKDLFNTSIEDSERWRLFRQILEALSYIHSMGMIHRDLKPSNIFLDENLNIKIGDFGLAILAGNSINTEEIKGEIKGEDLVNFELTSGIGTMMYLAPEIISNQELIPYDQKVDMYSLGIIFFELWHYFDTAMERVFTLQNIRNGTIKFTDFMEFPEFSKQNIIVQRLLQSRPEDRPSSAELLNTGNIPGSLHFPTLEKGLEILADSNSHYRHKALSILFSQQSSKYVETLFDSSMRYPAVDEKIRSLYLWQVILRIMSRHGAVWSDKQLLFPFCKVYTGNKRVVTLLDKLGHILQLPYDLNVPYVRSVLRNANNTRKTFTIAEVYREDVFGGAPKTMKEIQFGILSYSDFDDVIDEAEAIKVVDEILTAVLPEPDCSIVLNTIEILNEVLDFSKADKSRLGSICSIISNLSHTSWPQIKAELRLQSLVPSSSIDILKSFNFSCNIFQAEEKLALTSGFSTRIEKLRNTFRKLNKLQNILSRMAIKSKLLFNPLTVVSHELYIDNENENLIFKALCGNLNPQVVCAGGRFSTLYDRVENNSMPLRKHLSSVTFNAAFEKLENLIVKNGYETVLKRNPTFSDQYNPKNYAWRCEVLLGGTERVDREMLIDYCAEFWNHDVRADYIAKSMLNIEELVSHAKTLGSKCAILVKARDRALSGIVRLRMVDGSIDIDLRKSELLAWINYESSFNKAENKMFPPMKANSIAEQSSIEVINFDANRKDLDKRRRKAFSKQKAVLKVQDMMHKFYKSLYTIPIISVDLDIEKFKKLKSTHINDEESWKNFYVNFSASQKQAGNDLLKCLKETQREYIQWAFICSVKCNQILLYSLKEDH